MSNEEKDSDHCQKNVSSETAIVQLGNRKFTDTGSINTPIFLSTTYQHPEFGQSTGYDYTRTKNPTRAVLEEGLALLENGRFGFATSSGMSAILLVLDLFDSGSHIVASRDLYGGSYRYFTDLEKKSKITFSYSESEEQFETLIQEDTVALFVETPTNPLMEEVSIENLAKIAKKHQILLIVDNTFYTPYIQKPLDLGADIVIHSATKYLCGHNDVLAGAVMVKDEKIAEQLEFQLNTTGVVLSPFDSWLVIRGLKTFPLRMERHEANAKEVVAFLKTVKEVKKVFYPGRGGMVSFKINNESAIGIFLNALKVVTFAESLGGVESLITYPTTQTHADIPEKLRIEYGLTNDLLRLSVGIERSSDIIQDLQQAFEKIEN